MNLLQHSCKKENLDALSNPSKNKWIKTIENKMQLININEVYELVVLLKNKWILK